MISCRKSTRPNKITERTRAGDVSCQLWRSGPPASLSSGVSREYGINSQRSDNDFSDCFSSKPDFRPYKCLPVDPLIFDPEKAKDPQDPDYGRARKKATVLDDPDDMYEVLERGEKEAKPR